MNFGQALELIKQGKLVTREGWNGKGMFIFKRPADILPAQFVIEKVKSLPESVKIYFDNKFDRNYSDATVISFTPYLCMKAADDTIVNGWLASQTDMLSEDWKEFVF